MKAINRRQFLASSALGAAGTAVTTATAAVVGRPLGQPWNAGKGRSLKKHHDPVATLCVGCQGRCALLAYRDNGRVVQVGPNPAAGGSLCARAYQQVEALYDPERVLQPLARVGARGAGKWQAISWAEALKRLRVALAGQESRAWVELGRPDPLALESLQRLGVENVAGWRSGAEQARREAERAVYGAPLGGVDLTDVRTVLLVGAQPWDNGAQFAPLAKALATAQVDGAEVIAASAYQGATGSVASRWLPLKPGSEASLVLGLAHLVLVSAGVGGDALAARSNLTGAELRQALAGYTPERVAADTGLGVEEIQQLARRVSRRQPALCLAETAAAADAAALVAATALLNVAGGSGARLQREPQLAGIPAVDPERARDAASNAVASGGPISCYLAYRANPAYRGGAALKQALADEERVAYLVAMDTQLTETAQLADLVLPAAADLELWNLFAAPDGAGTALTLQQPAPRAVAEAAWLRRETLAPAQLFDGPENGPLGQARQLGDVLQALAAGTPQPTASVAARIRQAAAALSGTLAANAIEILPASSQPKTQPLALAGQLAASGASGDQAQAQSESFALVTLHHAQLDPAYANTRWGREVRRDNPLYINQTVARRLGLKAGHRVRVRHGEAQVTAKVQPIAGIHPEAVALAADFGHWAGGMAATGSGRPDPALPAYPTDTKMAQGAVPWWQGAGIQLAQIGVGAATGARSDRGSGPLRVVLERA